MTIAIVAEKPSVARDLAAVLGARQARAGRIEGGGYVVTWAIGHLVGIAEPQDIEPRWRRWDMDDLPMLPPRWPLVVLEETKDQYAHVERVMLDRDVTEIIAATDAGREGELIFRYVYRKTGCTKPVKRLWISSLTPEAIRRGMSALAPLSNFDPLARAALGRSRADWLVGMNLSRAYSLAQDDHLSVGRVQTPTLAMIVERELEIRAFVPEDYLEVWATFDAGTGKFDAAYIGPASGAKKNEAVRLPIALPARGSAAHDAVEASAIVARVADGEARVASVKRETKRIPAPLLYDLTELQRHANRLFGLSAKRTLETAQALYERHKLISYPRTSSRHLSNDVAATVPSIVQAIVGPYRASMAPGAEARALPRRFVDDAKVTDHHAILPTDASAEGRSLSVDERRVYDLVCRRLLQALHDDHLLAVTTVLVDVTSAVVDRFFAKGESVEQIGWKALDVPTKSKDEKPKLPPGLAAGQPASIADPRAIKKTTKPPPRFSDATLLTAMESAGRALDDKELAEAMRAEGLGTPATRAQTLETLLDRKYVERDGKVLVATDKGVHLIEIVDPAVKSPILTGQWEAKLGAMERGDAELVPFLRGIEAYVTEVVGRVRAAPMKPRAAPPPSSFASAASSSPGTSARASSGAPTVAASARVAPPKEEREKLELGELLRRVFGFDGFRPHQEEVCRLAAEGRNVLLVMPTGAGKSLCYQLPGLARGGTTLVVSPLIALMEDQVAKLSALGLAAERIHSGRGREGSRAASRAYLDGTLDYLFIAPERLKVAGFGAMLAKRQLALIAIDEAHCISQWGHDFRPDYRLLGEHLGALRGAPVVALTATATPEVQDDIVKQLGLDASGGVMRFIHGFRRENIGVEVVDMNPGDRTDAVKKLLTPAARRPAIVYVQTRKVAEAMADTLGVRMKISAYHAGMPAKERDDVQRRFLGGDLDAIVATIAFGMGVDKPDIRTIIHAGLPQTVEGYYQEIGRAGRDGLPSRAVLFHSFVDRQTHEYFLARDYPEPADIEPVFKALSDKPVEKDALAGKIDAELLDKAIEKLWLHGGAILTRGAGGETFTRGSPTWKASYAAQRAHRWGQLREMQRFAEATTCRMVALIRHFGDAKDGERPCGVCDVCSPGSSIAQTFSEPSAAETATIAKIVGLLRSRDGLTVGQLHKELERSGVERRAVEHVVAALARSRVVRIEDDTFEKDGVAIAFRRVWLDENAGSVAAVRVAVRAKTFTKKGKGKKGKRARGAKGGASSPVAKEKFAPGTARQKPARGGALFTALKAWRGDEAERRGVPAFRILTDRALLGIVDARPASELALQAISGVGAQIVSKYGSTLLALVRATG